MIRVSTAREAWKLASGIFPYEYTKDEDRSASAGYGVYTANDDASAWISDLGSRLEVNMPGETVNIWIDDPANLEVREDDLLNYLRVMMHDFKKYEELFGIGDRIVGKKLDAMIACKEMVESVIMKPVNLKVDGRVTVGLD